MKKMFLGSVVIIALVLAGGYYFYVSTSKVGDTLINEAKIVNSNPQNATYLVENEPFVLVNGLAEKDISFESETKNKLSIIGEPAYGDIDGDGDEDAVLVLINEPGGSGTFYYAAIAVNDEGKYKGTDTVLLGDRIVPGELSIADGKAIVNYIDHSSDEIFVTPPSVEKSLILQADVESLRLILIANDFEGEADENVMTLDMKPWNWQKTTYNNDTELVPNKPEDFRVTFNDDGTFSAQTDCNSLGGSYEVQDNKISFGNIAATMMFCEGSKEQEFSAMLGEVQSYLFTSKGELVLELKMDSGSSVFR
ncbi:META domain-containing protein [Candidatus Nomurabacteria bacterium]|nr:META domain-containing protein [Candidatus Kaiserbacteria bacterium]MCB9814033.1 META domain-containing protein [Candidatus Nomurabacteria bacterium]